MPIRKLLIESALDVTGCRLEFQTPVSVSVTTTGGLMERSVRVCLNIAILVMLSACANTASVSGPVADQNPEKPRVPNEYLVTLAPDADAAVIARYYGRFGIKYVHALAEETYLLILSRDPGPATLENLIQNEPDIRVVQPNLIQWDYRK
jgi:hypothetical protein